MIYLDNKTEGQQVWIPRNDLGFIPQKPTDLEGKKVTIDRDITYVYPSSGFIGMSSVTINAEAYAQRNYDDGFDDGFLDGMSSGYTEGETHQKSLLVSTAFTENGEYSKEDGWSAVTVNVPTGSTVVLEEKTVVISADTTNVLPSSGYDGMSAVTIDASDYAQQNYEGGYTSGHSQGMADQKALLSTTALTENGSYSRENGWSGVTVNIDTASTWNSGYNSGHTDGVSEEKAKMSAVTFTANTAVTLSDGSYSAVTVDIPQTGYTQQDLDNAFASGETVGENTIIATFSSTTATTNGQYGSTAHPLSSITVNVPQTGVSIPLSSITINSNTAITVNDVAYTGITVNVPLVYFDDYIHNRTMQSDPPFTYHIDTNIIPTTGTTMRVRGMSKGYDNGNTIIGHTEDLPYPHFRGFWTNGNIYFDNAYHSGRIQATWSGNTDGNPIDITFANFSIYDNITETMLATGSTYYGIPSSETLKVDVASWWVKQIEIWDGETKVFDGVAAHNSNGEIGLYDYVSQKMYTNSNLDIVYENLTPVIEPNKSFTATSNGDYTITPLSFQLVVNESIKSITFDASQYPDSGDFDLGRIYYNDNRDYYIDILFEYGEIGYSDSHWPSGGDFRCYKSFTGDTIMKIEFEYLSFYDEDVEWVGYETGFTYDAMSAVTLNVNVDTASTYNSGYTSGYTDGFASGSSQGYIGGIESSLFGAYYPIDSATNKSYCTHFPDLEKGKSIYFDIISTSSRVANKMFGGDYMNRDEHYLMIGYDNSNNEIDIQINAKGTPSGITTNAYLTLFNPTSGSIIYNPNQRICGEIAVTDTECNYGVACLGFVPNKYTVQGDFTGSYPIKFNQDCASAFTLCKVVYRDIATGAFEHYFSYDSSTNEIKDWITGDIAPTYDYNGNRVYGVLETKEL